MNDLSFNTFEFWVLITVQVIGFLTVCLKIYAKSYSTEKGKNLATKEDVGEITEIVESIKTSLAIKTEELKSDLSYKNEHLIHLRASEREAIINYYKATWVLILGFTRTDLVKYTIDNFNDLNKIKDEVSNLKYLRDISESELMFFYDEPDLTAITGNLNKSLSEFERSLLSSVNSLLQLYIDLNLEIVAAHLSDELSRKRSEILANWYEDRRNNFEFIRTFNEELKRVLLKRVTNLTS